MNHLQRALELAERGRGKVRDHPLVGAVVVSGASVFGHEDPPGAYNRLVQTLQ